MNLREIARAAGVSLTSVSLVLNGKNGVGSEKRGLIQKLLIENGYQPRLDDTPPLSGHTIHFLKYVRYSFAENINPGFASQIIDAAAAQCRKLGYRLSVSAFEEMDSREFREPFSSADTKGILLLGTALDDDQARKLLDVKKPIVIIDNGLDDIPITTVTVHNRIAITSAINHLAALGHKRIGFLASSVPCDNDWRRRRAFERTLKELGLPFSEDQIYLMHPTMEGSRESMLSLIDSGTVLPTALVANKDSIAIGALQAMHERGIRVPDDISLTGLDGLSFSKVSDPPLTTFNVPMADIGKWSALLLHDLIVSGCSSWNKMWLGTELEVRGSTGPCRE